MSEARFQVVLWQENTDFDKLKFPVVISIYHRSMKNCDMKIPKSNSSVILLTLKEDYDSRNLLKLFKPYSLNNSFT